MFRKAPTPTISEHAKLRTKQISEFLKLNPTAQTASGPGSSDPTTTTYQLTFSTPTIGPLTLTIILGPLFPERPPVCQLTTQQISAQYRLQHRYLDANGYLSLHPKLQPAHWSPHQNLGLVIQELVRELALQPPILIGGAMPSFAANSSVQPQQPQLQQQQYQPPTPIMNQPQYPSQPLAGSNSYSNNYAQPNVSNMTNVYLQSAQQQQQQQPQLQAPQPIQQHSPALSIPTPNIPPRSSPASIPAVNHVSSPSSSSVASVRTRPPELPTSFPSLDGLSIAQLEQYLSGDAQEQSNAIKDLAHDQPEVRQMEEIQKQLCQRIQELAQTNLSQRDSLSTLAAEVQFEATKLHEQHQAYQSRLQRQQAAISQYNLSHILQVLDESIHQSDELADQTKSRYESLVRGSQDEQTLLEQYIKERMVYHERTGKRERLVEMYGRQ